ncbi:MAG TPA: hypothetical protein VGK59_13920 [Ohtaekwangia sp.]
MRTGKEALILKTFLTVFFLNAAVMLCAQDLDTVTTKPFDTFWTRPRTVPKIGVGVQDRAFLEIGLQWHNIYKDPLIVASKGPYCTIDLFIDESNLLLGPKLGYEFTAGVIGTAIDLTYFIDQNYNEQGSDRESLVLTPKIGLTILGFADLFYGYQIPLSEVEITSIYRNRFSLVFNLNRDYFNLKEAPRKYRRSPKK